ncbi:hypothetical protein PPL_10335 [Heterostelium album PN500]|uniref:C3H1-type domain-containing protein n=1 Tax=Heterostelium pallidum (strain ATCC 26659 / Pp 5 / PN500) TaxID=670386 RepID=D3BQ15_HETP5|nr:hypothetical protein PPL_10335 [Heterostelium album PN500]EFA76566.1 hypothetical protein PPL_10335 [Heterostelium album PN500]|eukprot:XP_020428698.1 hypothetical protein PPL_10335 [Heterostelium album PN500]
MGQLKDYCYYCDKKFNDTFHTRKKHNDSIKHKQNVKNHFEYFRKNNRRLIQEEVQSIELALFKSKQPCKFLLKFGRCKFMSSCRYLHSLSSSAATTTTKTSSPSSSTLSKLNVIEHLPPYSRSSLIASGIFNNNNNNNNNNDKECINNDNDSGDDNRSEHLTLEARIIEILMSKQNKQLQQLEQVSSIVKLPASLLQPST